MSFFLQDPFNFNIEISVSWGGCRYRDPAGFMPRGEAKCPGAPPHIQAIRRSSASFLATLALILCRKVLIYDMQIKECRSDENKQTHNTRLLC